MLRKFFSNIKKHLKVFLWLAVPLLIWAAIYGYSFAWTGFAGYTTPNGEFVPGKTFWDWMDLFIVPIVLAVGAFYLNSSERERERERAEKQATLERERAEERAKVEREIATDRQREAAFQSYIDRMEVLLLDEKLRTTKNEEVRDVARTRTLSVLRSLDGNRKSLLFQFLVEAKLIGIKKPVIQLNGADLTDLSLMDADLTNADLSNAKLSKADLSIGKLDGANLCFADLSGVSLLVAKLNGADLSFANLTNADLIGANLTNAKVTNKQLEKAKSLKGATMPDGTKHD